MAVCDAAAELQEVIFSARLAGARNRHQEKEFLGYKQSHDFVRCPPFRAPSTETRDVRFFAIGLACYSASLLGRIGGAIGRL